jgi:hypothetical protein
MTNGDNKIVIKASDMDEEMLVKLILYRKKFKIFRFKQSIITNSRNKYQLILNKSLIRY